MGKSASVFFAMTLTVALWLLISLVCGVSVPATIPPGVKAQSGVYTLTFQSDVSPPGYAGASDTWIDAWFPTENHGTEAEVRVKGDGPQRALLLFDLSGHLPAGARVISATLWLRVNSRSADTPIRIAAYPVQQSWVATEATWNLARAGQAWWGGGGCEGTSRSPTPVASVEVKQAPGAQVALDVTAAVQGWVDNPSGNAGLLLKGDAGYATYRFASSDYPNPNDRPRLVVVWEGSPPLATPTRSATPTKTATPQVYTVMTSTLGDWKWWNVDDCLKVNEVQRFSRVSTMLLIYRGTIWSARLHVTFCNTDSPHPIYLNGVQVGTAPTFSTANCECNFPPLGGYAMSFDIDPALLVAGPTFANAISTTNAFYPWDTFKAYRTYLVVTGDITGPTRSYFAVGTDTHGDPLKGAMQLPVDYDPSVARPLLISLPGTGEDKDDALNRYATRANGMGWLLASVDMRRTSSSWYVEFMRTPSLAVQQDVMNLVRYMQANYRVDPSRVYIAGFSTGAGTAATIAAKYPDVFAGVLDYAGPTDYTEWYNQRGDIAAELQRQFGGSPTGNFEYPRRSSRVLARNLQYVPMRIVHGTGDAQVAFTHSSRLYNEVMPMFYSPLFTFKELLVHAGGHEDLIAGVTETDLQFLAQHTLTRNPRHLQIITDEAKGYYWLSVDKMNTASNAWRGLVEMDARYDPGLGSAWLTVKDGEWAEGKPLTVTLDLAKMGLDTLLPYDIEEVDPGTGQRVLRLGVLPIAGKLVVAVPRNALGVVHRQYAITSTAMSSATSTPTATATPSATSTDLTPLTPTLTATWTPTRVPTATPTATPTRTAAPGRPVYVRLDPQFPAVSKDQVLAVDIQVVAGSQRVDGVQVFLFYDPSYLQVVDAAGNPAEEIQSNGYLGTVIRNTVHIDGPRGMIYYAAGVYDPLQPRPSGTFAVATVRFRSLWGTAGGTTPLIFGTELPHQTEVTFEGASVLADVGNGSVTISGEAPPPTPTLVPTPSQTATCTPTATPTRTSTPTITPTPRSTVQVCLQKGSLPDSSYVGAYDTYLSSWDSPSPPIYHGRDLELALRQDKAKRILLRFELQPHVPVGSHVVVMQAHLSLWVAWVSNASPMNADLYRVNRSWDELTALWSTPWSTAGCDAVPADREGSAAASAVVGASWGSWVDWDVTDLVRQWVSGQAANHGVIIMGRSGDFNREVTFRSADHPAPSYHPRLCVSYYLLPVPTGTVTPGTTTSTATASATATPTATASPSATSTQTASPTSTQTSTPTPSPTATLSPTWTSTATQTRTATATGTPTRTATCTPTATASATASLTATLIQTRTVTPTPTATRVSLPGDMDGDCDVDVVDVMLVAGRWSTRVGDPDYDPRYDADGDGDIDVVDVMFVAGHYGETCAG